LRLTIANKNSLAKSGKFSVTSKRARRPADGTVYRISSCRNGKLIHAAFHERQRKAAGLLDMILNLVGGVLMASRPQLLHLMMRQLSQN